MKSLITVGITILNIASVFAQEKNKDTCQQAVLNFITKQEYEKLVFFEERYPFFPSKEADVNIRGGSLELRLDSKWLELKSCFEYGEYSVSYKYIGYIELTQSYICEYYELHDQEVLIVDKKSGDITHLYPFAVFSGYGRKVITYGENRDDISGGVIKVYDYIDGKYTCMKEIRDEDWYPVRMHFYSDNKIMGKIKYYGEDRWGYFWISV